MSTVQSFLPYDGGTVAHYTTWAQGIGSALSTLGWTKVADTAGVTWANVTTLTNVPQYATPVAGTVLYAGAFTAGSGYTNGAITGAQTTFSIVTDVGLTYACVVNPQSGPITSNGVQALQNSAATLTVTAVAASSSSVAIYTASSGVTASMIGQQFVVTIGGSNLAANNAGTFVCVATSGTTSITLGNPAATAQASVTGGSPGAQAISSTSVMSFINLNNSTNNWCNIGSNSLQTVNGLVTHSLVVAGWTGGSTANNATITVTSNCAITDAASNSCVCATFTGTNATQTSGVTITDGTHPASNSIHWVPYNYEIWKSNGPLSSAAPIYIKFTYLVYVFSTSFIAGSATNATPAVYVDVGTANPSVGQLGGNHTQDSAIGASNNTGVGNTYECDFSAPNGDELAFIMWRNGTSQAATIPWVLYIDRTKDQSGNPLSTFFTYGFVSSGSNRLSYTLFNAQTGGVINYQPAGGNAVGWTIPIAGPTGLAYQGLTPVLPIFPLPGYVANPVLMAVAMKTNDFTDGQLVNAVLYGGSHTFLMSKSTVVDQPQLGAAYAGIRWE